MKKIYLLGANTKHELVFCEVVLRHPRYYDNSKLKYVEDMDNVQLSINFYAAKLLLSKQRDNDRDKEYCGLYGNEAIANNKSLYFDSCHCGQYDTRKDGMLEYTSEEAYNTIHELWDNYHLEVVSKDVLKQLGSAVRILVNIDDDYWINDFIGKYREELKSE